MSEVGHKITIDSTYHETAIRQNKPVYFEEEVALCFGLWYLSPYEASDMA